MNITLSNFTLILPLLRKFFVSLRGYGTIVSIFAGVHTGFLPLFHFGISFDEHPAIIYHYARGGGV